MITSIRPQVCLCMNRPEHDSSDYRRVLVLVIAIGLLLTCGIVTWKYGQAGSSKFVAAATGRVGLVMVALWLAWPSLRKPASWLPPGFAVGDFG